MSRWKTTILLTLACLTLASAWAEDQPKSGSGSTRAKVLPAGPVEIEPEPLRREAPSDVSAPTMENSSQVGVQLKLRKRDKSKPRVAPEQPEQKDEKDVQVR